MLAGGRRSVLSALALASALVAVGCGEEEKRFGDDRIVESLNLEEADGTYAIGGDPFCAVEDRLLNTADEVDEAHEVDDIGLVIASGEGNVGVQGVPPFASDCKRTAQKRLNKLDPKPKDD